MRQQIQVYAGTAGHSAWFSEDSGDTWVHPNSHSGLYLEARVWTLASHPLTPERLLAGTDMGVFLWNEPTARWKAIASPMQDVWALAIDPNDPDFVIAGSRPAGLCRSRDGGQSWTRLEVPGVSPFSEINMGATRVTQILFDPASPTTIWATIEIGGIFRSTDRGESWTLCDRGLISADVHGIAVLRMPGGGTVALATTNRGLHRSEDGGESWVLQPLDSPWQYTRAVAPRADDDAVVFLTNGNGPPGNTGRLLRSRDYGRTWEDAGLPPSINSTPWCIATNAADPQTILTCTNLGQVFRSRDGGESWTRLAQEFGELRALHWRPLKGLRRQPHSLTQRTAGDPFVTTASGSVAPAL